MCYTSTMLIKNKRKQSSEVLLNKLWSICEADVQLDVATFLGCTQATISLMYSTKKVSRKMKENIEEKTLGCIKKKDWVK